MSVPLGFQQLHSVDELSVTSMKNYSSSNKYTFSGPDRTELLQAREEHNGGGYLLAGRSRDLRFQVFDPNQRELFTIDRDYSLGPSKVEVGVGGRLASSVRRRCAFLRNNYSVHDAYGARVLKVKGPISVYGTRRFILLNNSGEEVGVLTRRGNFSTHNEFYNLKFPRDLDVRIKAALISLCILIDVTIYEGQCF